MAVAGVAFLGTKAVDGETTTGWNAGNADPDIFVEGSGSIGAKASNTTVDFYDLSVTGSPYDFSSGGADEGDHIYAWFNTLTPAALHAIIAADDLATDSVGCWNVGPPPGYGGGWISYVVDPSTDFSTIIAAGSGSWTTTSNPTQLAGVDGFGGRHSTSTSIMGNFNNALVDAVSVGTGYRITRGDSTDPDGVFADLIAFEQTTSNRFGALRSDGGVLFMLGEIIIGDTTANSHDFTDSGFTVVWIDAPASATLYRLTAEQGAGATNVTLTNGTLRAEDPAQAALPLMDFSGITNWTNTNVNIIGARAINLDSNVTINSGTWESCGQVDLGGQPTIDGLTILNPTDDGAVLVNATNELANISNLTIDGHGIGGTSSDAGMEIDITGAGPFTLTFDNINFQNRVSGSVDVHILANDNADYTINLINGSSVPTITNDGSGTVTAEITVPVTVTVRDASDNTVVSGARVLMLAGVGGDLPSGDSVTITRSGSTASASHTAHGLANGDKVMILGADQDEYNGVQTITNVTTNAYDFTVANSPTTPATGTITSTAVILDGETNGSGVLSNSGFSYTSDQPVGGRVRRGSAATYYKTSPISGDILDNGLSLTVLLIRD